MVYRMHLSSVYNIETVWLSATFLQALLAVKTSSFVRLAYLHLARTLSTKTAEDLLSRSSALMWNTKWLLSLSQPAVGDHTR